MNQLTDNHKDLVSKICELADQITQQSKTSASAWYVIPGGLDNVGEVRTMDGITVYKKETKL